MQAIDRKVRSVYKTIHTIAASTISRRSTITVDWSSLPADLLLAVLARLPHDADRASLRAVCAAWRAASASWRPRPWLVGSRTDRLGRGAVASSFWLSRGDSLLPFAAAELPHGFEYLSSTSHGCLVLSDTRASSSSSSNSKAIALFNPVTGRRIHLPPIGFYKRWHDVSTVVLSSDPAAAGEWAAVAVGFPTNSLAYYSSATRTWTPLAYTAAGYAGVEHYEGKFYVAFDSNLCVCVPDAAVPAVIPLEQIDDDDGDNENAKNDGVVLETHLVECDGELLLVSVRDKLAHNNPVKSTSLDDGDGRAVEVFRVEWVSDDGVVRLVRDDDLDSHALFLGRNRAFALSPDDFPACRANCVYLVDQQGHPDGRVRVFDLNPSEESVIPRRWAVRDKTIYPDDGRRGALSAGWARRGWFFPKY